jgi:hypothetical protein
MFVSQRLPHSSVKIILGLHVTIPAQAVLKCATDAALKADDTFFVSELGAIDASHVGSFVGYIQVR